MPLLAIGFSALDEADFGGGVEVLHVLLRLGLFHVVQILLLHLGHAEAALHLVRVLRQLLVHQLLPEHDRLQTACSELLGRRHRINAVWALQSLSLLVDRFELFTAEFLVQRGDDVLDLRLQDGLPLLLEDDLIVLHQLHSLEAVLFKRFSRRGAFVIRQELSCFSGGLDEGIAIVLVRLRHQQGIVSVFFLFLKPRHGCLAAHPVIEALRGLERGCLMSFPCFWRVASSQLPAALLRDLGFLHLDVE